MNLLITGGAGFIGSNLIHHVIDRPEVTKLVNLDCLTYAGRLENLAGVAKHPKYVFEKVDLRDKTAVLEVVQRHGITHVMHLAAESHVDRSITGPGDFIHTNVVGTFNLLEACRATWHDHRTSGHRFHHVSTDEVYGSLGPTGFFTETTPYAPNSPYSASKASSDMLVRAYHHTYGLPTVITNCSNNYGPYQFPGEAHPGGDSKRAGAQTGARLWRRHERARLALRARPRGSAVAGADARARRARPTTSAATTNGPTSPSCN